MTQDERFCIGCWGACSDVAAGPLVKVRAIAIIKGEPEDIMSLSHILCWLDAVVEPRRSPWERRLRE